MLFELVMIFATLAVGSNATGIDGALATGDSIGLVEATADQALRSIRAAEASGADVSHLTEKFKREYIHQLFGTGRMCHTGQ
jgi:hypothetical protein